jgi:hypothetical protein
VTAPPTGAFEPTNPEATTMKRTRLPLALTLILIALPAAAQPGSSPAADPSAAFDVYGTVLSFTAAYGSGLPMLVVEDAALGTLDVGLGPVWFLQAADFAAAPGDEVEALVFPCPVCAAPYVAMWVENLTTGAAVDLRGEDGRPLWIQRGGPGGGQPFCNQGDPVGQLGEQRGPHGGNGNGNGPQSGGGNGNDTGKGPQGGAGDGNGPQAGGGPNGNRNLGGQCDWTGPDMTQVATATGTVLSLDVGFGNTRPSVFLEIGGEEVEIMLMPYAPIAAAGFLIEIGSELQVTYAPWITFGGEEVLVALSVTDPATGLTIQLRDPETGYPVTGGGGGFGPHFGYGPGPGPGPGGAED